MAEAVRYDMKKEIMRKKKKNLWIPLCLSMGMLLGLGAGPAVLAADQTTTIYTDVVPAYTVTIPKTVEIPYHSGAAQKLTLTASGCSLEAGKSVRVAAVGSGEGGAFVMKNGSASLAYELSASGSPWSAVAPGAQVARFTGDGSQDVFVKVHDWTTAQAGRYSGTITFTMSYR